MVLSHIEKKHGRSTIDQLPVALNTCQGCTNSWVKSINQDNCVFFVCRLTLHTMAVWLLRIFTGHAWWVWEVGYPARTWTIMLFITHSALVSLQQSTHAISFFCLHSSQHFNLLYLIKRILLSNLRCHINQFHSH